MSDSIHKHIVELQFEELVKYYPALILKRNADGSFLISGDFSFSADYNDLIIKDKFALEITVPNGYPSQLPIVREIGGRIPKEKDYHVNPSGSLCLNVPLELRKIFHNNGTLLDFVNRGIIHFLYAFCHREKYGTMPYGEWSHGGKGLVEYYQEVFKVSEGVQAVGLLRILADNDFQRQMLCPCGSKLKLRRCHGRQLGELIKLQELGSFMYDYIQVLSHLADEKQKIPREFFSKAIYREFKRSQNDS